MMNQVKDVEIGETKYQIGPLRAKEGSWALSLVLTRVMPALRESLFREDGAGAALALSRSLLSEDEFWSLQRIALSVVRRYENGVPMPVFVLPDTFAVKELEYDLAGVMRLTVESLAFNLQPFFQDGGLNSLLSSLGLQDQNS